MTATTIIDENIPMWASLDGSPTRIVVVSGGGGGAIDERGFLPGGLTTTFVG